MLQLHAPPTYLHAVNQEYTKHSQGYVATGVATVSCCHVFVLPNGVVDLQKGKGNLIASC